MYGNDKEIKFRVLDLYNGKVLEGEEIPIIEGNLPEIIRQFSGMNYQLSEYTGLTDVNNVEIYDEDKVIVYKYDNGLREVGKGEVSVGINTVVDFTEDGVAKRCYLDDMNLDLKVVGNHFDKWEDISV